VPAEPESDPTPGLPVHWRARQESLAARVSIPTGASGLGASPRILALDVQYVGEVAYLGGSLVQAGRAPLTFVARAAAGAPYVPGAFCFREGPPLIAFVEAIRDRGEAADLLLVDGHGIAHPRRIGVASWVGVETGIPSLGCAKGTLLRCDFSQLGLERGQRIEVVWEEEVVGYVLRTRAEVKPVFVSPGHGISLAESVERVLELPGEFRVPDPLRAADHAARQAAKGTPEGDWVQLGSLESRAP
jgi:deoxyribonuclease V